MAEIQSENRKNRKSIKIDFTPMVDLGFLLITFFMLTTVLSKPNVLSITMPVEDESPTTLTNSTALTVILSENDRIYYHYGMDYENMQVTAFSKEGIRKILLDGNSRFIESKNALQSQVKANKMTTAEFEKQVKELKNRNQHFVVLIKSDDKAKYGNLVDMLDEIQITGVAKYIIANPDAVELEQIAAIKN